jgi:hypothetical protein
MSRTVRSKRLASFRPLFDASITVSHRNISKLKHKFKGTPEEWEQLLSHFLLQTQPEEDTAKLLENVRMVYALKGGNVEIVIQQDVKGIKASQTSTPLERLVPGFR